MPAPRARLTKAATALYWGALTAAAAMLHAPFDRVGPMIVGLVMALPLSVTQPKGAEKRRAAPGRPGAALLLLEA